MKKRFLSLKWMGYVLSLLLPALLITEIFLRQVEKDYVEMALTNLDAQASVQKERIRDMIAMYYQRILGITSRRALKKNLADFWEYGDVAQIIRIKKILPNVKQPFSDFRQIFVFDREGHAVTSTEAPFQMRIPVNARILNEGRERLTVTFFEPSLRYDSKTKTDTPSKSLELLLMGPISFKGESIGGIGIIADNSTLNSIANDLSGLGKTGETRIAKKNDRGDAEIIVGGRYGANQPQAMANIPQHQLDNPMTQALFRYEGRLTNAVDYRGTPAFAATRFIPEEEWGIVVTIDKKEAMEPVLKLRRLAYSLLGIVLLLWLPLGFIWMK